MISPDTDNAAGQASNAGLTPAWGTIQGHVTMRNENGRTDAAWLFIPDDGGRRTRFARRDLSEDACELRLGDGARCTWDGQNLNVKLFPDQLRRAEELFAQINEMSAQKRALLRDDDGGLILHAGWAWDKNHMIRKAMPPRSRASSGAKRYPCTRCGRLTMRAEGRTCSRCRASSPAAPASALGDKLASDDKLRKMVELMLDDAATAAEAQAALTHARRRTTRRGLPNG